ncbi:MAG TPA: hypothetical protein EYP23_05200, partial [Thermoplasmata archaeon]|nr:hypothetical protein [Thermoplasmata archaeon]
SPCIADGRVYVGCSKILYCLDANTGGEIWSFVSGEKVFSSPAAVDGKVYFGSMDRHVYCLDAETGDMVWSYRAEFSVACSPVVAYGKVYTDSGKKLVCLDAETGAEV